jgi:hypothetical protein
VSLWAPRGCDSCWRDQPLHPQVANRFRGFECLCI